MDDYQEMIDDLDDLAALADCKGEEAIAWDEAKLELAEHGLL